MGIISNSRCWICSFIANTKKIVKVMTSVFFAENPPKGPLDVPVPQTVDKGFSMGVTMVYITEATITFPGACETTELKYAPKAVP
jgi:hypothetical protein